MERNTQDQAHTAVYLPHIAERLLLPLCSDTQPCRKALNPLLLLLLLIFLLCLSPYFYVLHISVFPLSVPHPSLFLSLFLFGGFQAQTALLAKFLSVAKCCYESRNFATAMQILTGLENVIIRQLPVSLVG